MCQICFQIMQMFIAICTSFHPHNVSCCLPYNPKKNRSTSTAYQLARCSFHLMLLFFCPNKFLVTVAKEFYFDLITPQHTVPDCLAYLDVGFCDDSMQSCLYSSAAQWNSVSTLLCKLKLPIGPCSYGVLNCLNDQHTALILESSLPLTSIVSFMTFETSGN